MRLLIVQYGGDYRQVFEQVRNQGIEKYYGHKYIIDTVSQIAKDENVKEVAFLCCHTQTIYNEEVESGIRVIAGGVEPYRHPQSILDIIQAQNPTHLVVHFPIQSIFQWGIKHNVKMMGLLADSFLQRGWKRRFQNYTWGKLLNHPRIDLVANHGINSCLSLQAIGVNPQKIIPWDYIYKTTPADFCPKTLNLNSPCYQLVYVGLVQENKGVGDLLAGVAKLPSHLNIKLTIIGSGEIAKFQHRATTFQIRDKVEFLGRIPQTQVLKLMEQADIVIVPSWHEYPEGMPLTIYEALSTHTPIVASDHPMFAGNLIHRHNAMIFPERNPTQLAKCIYELLTDSQLYTQISLTSFAAWENLQIPVKWSDLLTKWLFDSPENQNWLRDRSLASGMYDRKVKNH